MRLKVQTGSFLDFNMNGSMATTAARSQGPSRVADLPDSHSLCRSNRTHSRGERAPRLFWNGKRHHLDAIRVPGTPSDSSRQRERGLASPVTRIVGSSLTLSHRQIVNRVVPSWDADTHIMLRTGLALMGED